MATNHPVVHLIAEGNVNSIDNFVRLCKMHNVVITITREEIDAYAEKQLSHINTHVNARWLGLATARKYAGRQGFWLTKMK